MADMSVRNPDNYNRLISGYEVMPEFDSLKELVTGARKSITLFVKFENIKKELRIEGAEFKTNSLRSIFDSSIILEKEMKSLSKELAEKAAERKLSPAELSVKAELDAYVVKVKNESKGKYGTKLIFYGLKGYYKVSDFFGRVRNRFFSKRVAPAEILSPTRRAPVALEGPANQLRDNPRSPEPKRPSRPI
eukprot:NODE_341_length_10628_cov_0.466996.p5 type:complete len:191 gc:universal NODE_341_length_10628_cov_0.466996:9757-9185(-)